MLETITRNGTREQAQALPEITLEELGIKRAEDKLGLHSAPIYPYVIIDPRSGSRVYLDFVDHPFIGEHLVQLLNDLAPNSSGPEGIIDDLRLPDKARGWFFPRSEHKRLHRIHANDPRIGPHYNEFDRYNRKPWLKAITDTHLDPFFKFWRSIEFVDMTDINKETIDRVPGEFMLDKQALGFIDNAKRQTIAENIIRELSLTEQRRLSGQWLASRGRNLVDLRHKTHFTIDERPQLWIREDGSVEIRWRDDNHRRKTAFLELQVDKQQPSHWSTTKYKVDEEELSRAIFPLITFRVNGSGEMEFLSQLQANYYLRKFRLLHFPHSFQADTAVGQIVVGNCIPDFKIAGHGELEEGRYSQTIRGGQLPVMLNLRGYARRLLTEPCSPITKLREYSDSVAN